MRSRSRSPCRSRSRSPGRSRSPSGKREEACVIDLTSGSDDEVQVTAIVGNTVAKTTRRKTGGAPPVSVVELLQETLEDEREKAVATNRVNRDIRTGPGYLFTPTHQRRTQRWYANRMKQLADK